MKEQDPNKISYSQLVESLNRLGVEFLISGQNIVESYHDQPESLIAALSSNREARLRLALIPLFLQHPQLASIVPYVVKRLPSTEQITLKCYYCAALILQQKYHQRLKVLFGQQSTLPPLFLEQMGLQTVGDPDEKLIALAQKQQLLTGRLINWNGTYEHAVQRLLVHREREKA